MPTLHVQLLGEFKVLYDEVPVTTLNSARLQSLLAYLLLHRSAPQSRQHLAFLFWPDSTEKQARTNLRHQFHLLRQALPALDSFVESDVQMFTWRGEALLRLDVADFEQTTVQQNSPKALREAVDLYQSDLLPSCYDDWILPIRERLRQQFIEALERLVGLLEGEGDYRSAIHYTQRLLSSDPLHEVAYQRLMRLYAASGDRAAALRIYHTCTTLLRQELAVEPSPATQEVYEQLFNVESSINLVTPIPVPHIARAQLVGREAEWERMRHIWHSTVQGQPHLVLIRGEAGIGKTRLAEEFIEWVKRQGIATASARCYSAEQGFAYAPIVTWLRAEKLRSAQADLAEIWLSEVARLLPELVAERPDRSQPGPLTESWQRRRLFEALAHATLACTSHAQPLLLHLDDVQWADPETLEWLPYFLRFAQSAPVLLIVTLRTEEITPAHGVTSLLLSLRREKQISEIELGPLDAEMTATLAARVVQQELSPDLTALIFQETEGNPLFVVETMQARILEAPSKVAQRPQEKSLLPTIQAVITARLAQLSATARELAGLMATIGRHFTFDVLMVASSESEDILIRALDECWQRRVVREQGTQAYDFSHDKIREVAYAELSGARRRLYHRRVAQALERVYGSNLNAVCGQIASHYELASQPQQAISYYLRAATVAQQLYANEEAIRYYRQAHSLVVEADSLSEELSKVTIQIYEGLGDVLTLVGQHEQAKSAYQTALGDSKAPNSMERSRLYRKIGYVLRIRHDYEEAIQTYTLAEKVLELPLLESSAEQREAWVQIQLERMWVYYWTNQLHKSMKLVEEMRPRIEQFATPPQQTNLFTCLNLMMVRGGRYRVSEEALSLIQNAWMHVQPMEILNERVSVQFMLGFNLLWHGDLVEAEQTLQDAYHLAKQIGDVVHQARCITYLTVLYRMQKLTKTAHEYALESCTIAETAQMPEYVGASKANLAWVAWCKKDLIEAEALALTAMECWQALALVYPFRWLALWPLLGVALARHQFVPAINYVGALLDPAQMLMPDELVALLEEAINAWQARQTERTATYLHQAVTTAQKLNYL